LEENNINNEEKKTNLSFKDFISGSILTQTSIKKHLWYILFVVALSIVYISNKYQTEGILVDIIKLQKEVKELRDKSVSYASELMSISRESEVIKIVKEKGVELEELKTPPQKIEVKKEQE
jgi:cell division protein FtsL